jgi:hypothetical protein
MDETRLVLLMKDGPVSIISQGTLSPEQYADLHAMVKETTTAEGLMKKVGALSMAWGVPIVAERCRKPLLGDSPYSN